MKLDDLVSQAREYAERFHDAGLHPRLIGGLAVHLMAEAYRTQAEEELGYEVELLSLPDSRRLACLSRVTEDVDIAVPAPEGAKAESVLLEAGLIRDRTDPPPLRFTDHGRRVDLVEFETASADVQADERNVEASLALLEDAFESQPDPVTHLRHARPAALLVLKAVAYRSRWEERDLRDAARIALVDVRRGAARADLLALWPTLPRLLQNDVIALCERFAGPDAAGPDAFVKGIRDQVQELAYNAELEDDVRSEVAAAVQALLGWTVSAPR